MKVLLENLNDIKIGDLLCDNISKKPYRVKAVSENFILAFQNCFGEWYYTIYAKEPLNMFITEKPNVARYYTETKKLYYYRGPDNTLFGGIGIDDDLEEYMKQLESGELKISLKRRVTLTEIYKVVKNERRKKK